MSIQARIPDDVNGILNDTSRPEVSVFWRPGCSSCVKVKELVEDLGIEYESVNCADMGDPRVKALLSKAMEAGFRSIPLVRKGERFVYAQSLDDVAELLGVSRNHKRLPNEAIYDKWDRILSAGRNTIAKFSEEDLAQRALPIRERSVKGLGIHVFQIVNAFLKQMEEGVTEIKPIQAYVDPGIVTKDDLLAFMDDTQVRLRNWVSSGKPALIPERIPTHYGEQEFGQALERGAWHSGQHVRQLDVIAAGRLGAEMEVPTDLFDGLPLPRRLWN